RGRRRGRDRPRCQRCGAGAHRPCDRKDSGAGAGGIKSSLSGYGSGFIIPRPGSQNVAGVWCAVWEGPNQPPADVASRRMSKLLSALSGLVFIIALAQPCSAETRVALVVGNGAYQQAPPLRNPVNDASDVASALQRDGFQTIVAMDVDK